MNKRKVWNLAGAVVLLASIGVPSCLAYIVHVQALYGKAAPCAKLHGVDGVLQTAGLLAVGNCKLVAKGGCAAEGNKCKVTAASGSLNGYCKSFDSNTHCYCITN